MSPNTAALHFPVMHYLKSYLLMDTTHDLIPAFGFFDPVTYWQEASDSDEKRWGHIGSLQQSTCEGKRSGK